LLNDNTRGERIPLSPSVFCANESENLLDGILAMPGHEMLREHFV
jgi:hypothetical protein